MSEFPRANEENPPSDADRIYLRTQVLLFLLCQHVPAITLAALCSSASHVREDVFLRDLHISGLDTFVRHLALELCAEHPAPEEVG